MSARCGGLGIRDSGLGRALRAVDHECADCARPYLTWRCDTCGAEFDYFTYGGPCPGAEDGEGCSGELHHVESLPSDAA